MHPPGGTLGQQIGEQNVDDEMVWLDFIDDEMVCLNFIDEATDVVLGDAATDVVLGDEKSVMDQQLNDLNIRRRKTRSEVWKHFEKYDKNGKDRAICNLCKRDFDGSSKKGTTHLRNHLKICQKKRNGGGDKTTDVVVGAEATVGDEATDVVVGDEKSVMDQQLNDLNIRQRKTRSEVWKHFEKYDKNGKDRAICNLCKRDFDGSSKKGTTHLKNHLKICQKKQIGGGDKTTEDQIYVNIEAARVYDRAAFKLRGAKAILSFPLEAGKCEARTDEGACGRKRVRGGENEEVEKKRKVKVVNTRDELLMPSSFTGFWDCSDVNGIYNAPPLSPLSPHPVLGYPQLMVL